ncbi:Protein CBG09981 [Caenorhabditis briggsae]|uniref:Protein CBG09981 n=1 Tax=Caenorhabditis briggsae TaxID=6238 RepID=A8XA33_CAEBR|nr:Protein CBG09981 [Caenorhabditis briggsae]CAP29500.2 Protein CBG09981 [Caenorhabditis briggsae]
MSDIEILEDVEPTPAKHKLQNTRLQRKRKRTSSGLIEKCGTMKTEFEEFVIDRTITQQRKLVLKDVENSAGTESVSNWRIALENSLLGTTQNPVAFKTPATIRFQKKCFNCDGEHVLQDCPSPRDFRRISMKKRESADMNTPRRKFIVSNSVGLSKHKANSFKPGEMSETLRTALGLDINEIPVHVYRMRRLGLIDGYPPGWLRKAVKKTDVLKFYTADNTDNSKDTSAASPELDMSKIAWYPGFNEVDSNLVDHESFKVPPTDVFHSVFQEKLTEMFKKQRKAMKRSKSKNEKRQSSRHTKFTENDEEDDVVIVENGEGETDSTKLKFKTPGEDGVVVMLKGSDRVGDIDSEPLPKKDVEVGESLFSTIGIPVFEKLTTLAPLEAFAVGIQPFASGTEDVESKGIFHKLMKKLNDARTQNLKPESQSNEKYEKLSGSGSANDEKLSPIKPKKNKSKKKKKRRKTEDPDLEIL